jgi:geranylgeranyl reductase family protein
MKRCDVLVVGGGPAGSSLACRLADAGVSVLLADKAVFPRDKPCGGGLTLRAVRRCPVDVSAVVEEQVDEFELRFRYRDTVLRRMRQPVVWMTQRRRLDAFLLERARERDVDVRESAKVHFDGDRVLVDAERVAADVVVGADGANGVTARALGLGSGIYNGVAYEGNAAYSSFEYAHRSRAVIELAGIPGGYGWVFPKGDHANLGVGAWGSEGPRIREHLTRLCEAHGLRAETLAHVRGHRLPLRRPGVRIAADRGLLVGDAAGLIDPLSGDGMYECFVSAELGATSIVDFLAGRIGSLEGYGAAVDSALGPLHQSAWLMKKALDRWPRASWRIARSALLWRSVERLLTGELGAPGEQRGLAGAPLRALALLGR